MEISEFKDKLKSYSEKDIMITSHAEIQAYVRGVDLQEVRNNITNPEKLAYFEEQKAKNERF